MSDVIGPDTFDGLIFVALCALLALVLLLVAALAMASRNRLLALAMLPIVAMNAVVATVLFPLFNEGSFNHFGRVLYRLAIPWIVLCVVAAVAMYRRLRHGGQ